MVMGKKVWAICRGAVRWDFELYSTLAMLCDYRSRGLIEGIVISTWKDEVDKLPNLRQKLKDLNIFLTELQPFDESAEKFININYARQAYQLKCGLDFVPDDVFILCCRTDNSENITKALENILLENVNLSIGNHGGLNIKLNYKIVIMRYTIDRMFGCVDRGFFGYKADLYKMVNLEMTVKKYGIRLQPDIAFFSNIFMDYPIIEEFFKAGLLDSKPISDLLFRKLKDCLENEKLREQFELPTMLNKMYALYFILMNVCFCTPESREKKLDSFDIADVFAGNKALGMKSDSFAHARFKNPEILKMIVEGACKPTKGYIKLLCEIGKMTQPGYAEHIHCTREDYKELADWIKNYLKLDPEKIINFPNEIKKLAKTDIGFEQSLKILFSDCNINADMEGDFYSMMRDICFNKKRGYYPAIVDNLDNIRSMGQSLIEMALSPANRILKPEVLKICAKELYLGNIASSRIESTQYIFRKNSHKARFYSFPLPPDHISALYYYGKYAEPLGEDDVPKAFYTQLIRTFQLPVRLAPEAYADAVLELIKEIVDSSYQEFKENLSVRYLIDFLIDESLTGILAEEVLEALQEYIWDKKYALPFKKRVPDAFSHLLDVSSKIQEERTAKYVIRLILREKSGQSAYMKTKAQKIVNSLAERYNLQNFWFVRASNLKYNERFELNELEVNDNNDFVLLARILADKKCLRENGDIILNLCNENFFRYTIFYALLRKEFDTRIQFFGIKKEKEIWMNYTDFMNTGYDQKLIIGRNAEDLIWPQAESASKSSFAAYLKVVKDTLVFSIEFNAHKNTAKEDLLGNMDKTGLLDFDVNEKLIRFNINRISFDPQTPNSLQLAVNQALDEFCRIGDMLTSSATQLNEDNVNRIVSFKN